MSFLRPVSPSRLASWVRTSPLVASICSRLVQPINMRSAIRVVLPLTLVAAATLHAATEAPLTLSGLPSRFAAIDGARVHYKLAGRGRTTLLAMQVDGTPSLD